MTDMLTSGDRKEVDSHLQRGSTFRDIFRGVLPCFCAVISSKVHTLRKTNNVWIHDFGKLAKMVSCCKGQIMLCKVLTKQNLSFCDMVDITRSTASEKRPHFYIFRPQFEKLFVFVRVSVFFYVVFPPVIYGEISAADGTKCIALSLLTLMHKIIRFYPLIVEG